MLKVAKLRKSIKMEIFLVMTYDEKLKIRQPIISKVYS